MFKYTLLIFAMTTCVAAKPGVIAPIAFGAPIVSAPGVFTATSSQVIARNNNGIATAPVIAAAPLAARYVASPFAAPLEAAPSAFNYANYVSSPLAAPLAYSSPLATAPLGYAASYGYASPINYASAPLLL